MSIYTHTQTAVPETGSYNFYKWVRGKNQKTSQTKTNFNTVYKISNESYMQAKIKQKSYQPLWQEHSLTNKAFKLKPFASTCKICD